MVEARDQHLVARFQRATERPAEVKRQGRHVRAENNLIGRRCVEQVGDGLVGGAHHGVGLAAGREGAAVVGVAGGQVADHRVDDALRDLRAAGAVEVDRRAAVDGAL